MPAWRRGSGGCRAPFELSTRIPMESGPVGTSGEGSIAMMMTVVASWRQLRGRGPAQIENLVREQDDPRVRIRVRVR